MKKILILEKGNSIKNMTNNLAENEKNKMLISISASINSKIPADIPDLIIADLTTIKKHKVELLMQLKSNPVFSLVPFLFITSDNRMGSDEQFAAQNYYLNKPFTKENLSGLIMKIFNHAVNASPW